MRRIRPLWRLFVIASAIGATAAAQAGTVICSGTVQALSYHAGIGLMIQLSSMNTVVFFCDPDNAWTVSGTTLTTPVAACRSMWALFMQAKASGAAVNNMYFDGDNVPATCDAWAAWSRANIRHFVF